MAIVSSFLFTSYGRLSLKLYNIRLPAPISSILNIMGAVRNVKVCTFNLSVSFMGCVYLYIDESGVLSTGGRTQTTVLQI
jgi:hypothetical protein